MIVCSNSSGRETARHLVSHALHSDRRSMPLSSALPSCFTRLEDLHIKTCTKGDLDDLCLKPNPALGQILGRSPHQEAPKRSRRSVPLHVQTVLNSRSKPTSLISEHFKVDACHRHSITRNGGQPELTTDCRGSHRIVIVLVVCQIALNPLPRLIGNEGIPIPSVRTTLDVHLGVSLRGEKSGRLHDSSVIKRHHNHCILSTVTTIHILAPPPPSLIGFTEAPCRRGTTASHNQLDWSKTDKSLSTSLCDMACHEWCQM